uniref:Uncharacterized protein n=1 Tax=Rhizophora mucronata TaxID=61149 RepID=A0A2P2J613_RHIMU
MSHTFNHVQPLFPIQFLCFLIISQNRCQAAPREVLVN